jgi:beta-glucosidase-like glycosyl hydrolase
MRLQLGGLALVLALTVGVAAQPSTDLDAEGRRWVDRTLAAMSVEQLVGQLLAVRLDSTFLSSDTDTYDALVSLVQTIHAGHVVAFGGVEPSPDVLLNSTYGSIILGQPMSLASTLNRLQAVSPVPLLVAADFEWGPGMRIGAATRFPRAMAFGAAGDERLAMEAGRITAVESRAMGVHVNFAPVADVNNNPRNPVINIRSFGEDPARVGALVAASVRGLQQGGLLATLKHFPGHGDTDVDSHLGLPIIPRDRASLDAVELPPFTAGIADGASAVMVAHMELPALDPERGPATFSRPIVTGLLREQMKFGGLVYSDSMRMDAIAKMLPPGEAALRAVRAGVDVVIDSPDPVAAFQALKDAVTKGTLSRAQVEASVRRVLTAKARLRLHRVRSVNLEAVPLSVGGRRHEAVVRAVSERAVTLIKDERGQVPLKGGPDASVLYLSVLDYPSQWRTAAPSRAMIPELKRRWRDTESIELSDRSTPNELSLVAAMAQRFDVIVAGVFVRAASGSGRLDLSPALVRLLETLSRNAERRGQPFAVAFFGNPYAAMSVPGVPAMLLAFDFSDAAETAVVRALAGEIPVGGHLPIGLPGMFPIGHGLTRTAISASGARE